MGDPIGYKREIAGTQPPYRFADYKSTVKRSPSLPLVTIPHSLSEVTGPTLPPAALRANEWDLTRQHKGAPIGERLIVAGRVLDEDGRPVPDALVEIWQANAAGRYAHKKDDHDAPLDPNFSGAGRCVADAEGRYRFLTIKPGSYPWQNHHNAWRPAHIHFSLFGPAFATRLITQMYFPNDPLLPLDPIYNSVPDEKARIRMIAPFDLDLTEPGFAHGYRFDIVLRGRAATPMVG